MSVSFSCIEFAVRRQDISPTCLHCDLTHIERLLPLLLDKLQVALDIAYKGKGVNARTIANMKTSLIDAVLSGNNNMQFFLHDEIVQKLDQFALTLTKRGLLRLPTGLGNSGGGNSGGGGGGAVGDSAMVAAHFSAEERFGVARAIIRTYDKSFRHHCNQPRCGQQCPFAVMLCGNHGCAARFSRPGWSEHDAVCPNKIISCPLYCGEWMPRMASAAHCTNACVRRVVPCPYNVLGCVPNGKFMF